MVYLILMAVLLFLFREDFRIWKAFKFYEPTFLWLGIGILLVMFVITGLKFELASIYPPPSGVAESIISFIRQ